MADKRTHISAEEFNVLFEKLKNWGRWGPGDEKGTLNYITPDKVAAAAALVKSGRSVSMAIPIDTVAGPDNANPAIHYMAATHDAETGSRGVDTGSHGADTGSRGVDTGSRGADTDSRGVGFATDFLGMQFHGDCHTHLDALCHISYKGRLYGGAPASEVTVKGAPRLDVTACANGVAGRGVLIDAPRYRNVKWLEPGDALCADELLAIEKSEGVRLGEGDILTLRTGQCRRRRELGAWNVGAGGAGRAGIDPYCMELLHERKVAAFLPEGDGEVMPGYVEGLDSPIHALQICAMGMLCADSLALDDLAAACEAENRFEFMVVIAPLRLPGGTGSPFNPIAIF